MNATSFVAGAAEATGAAQNFTSPVEELYQVPPYMVILLSICYGSISVLATAGNGLVIWVIVGSRRMRNVTNYYIANLALADFLLAVFAIPFEFQAALLQKWNLPNFMCSFCPFVHSLSITVSVFTLTAIAVDRHRAILNPFTGRASKAECQIVISLIWISGILLSFPMGYAMQVIYLADENNKPFCFTVRFSEQTMQIYRTTLVLLQYVMPLSVIIWAYSSISFALWGNTTPGNAQSDRDANLMRNKKRVIKMLVIVVALFALCWLPLQTYNILQGVLSEINEYKYINIIYFCFDWFAMSNSCYNPFIYAIYNEKFKREFQMRISKLRLRKEEKKLRRDLSLFSSGRYEWRYNSTAREHCSMPANETFLLKESPSC
ncbi:tachykinin-like peptides receptor 99D [Planococcus citri]|uniref:tachykinin-like peptides receptor 99D n=1 Tax=Planococcus citri TaxID=170843 RepID=UPI0031F80CF1